MGGGEGAEKERDNPTVQMITRDGLTGEAIGRTVVAATGEEPEFIWRISPGVYRIRFRNKEASLKMLALHMSEIEEHDRPLQIKMVEQHLSTLEIFDLLTEKLTGKERAEMFGAPVEQKIHEVDTKPPKGSNKNGSEGKGDGRARVGAANAHASVPPRPMFHTWLALITTKIRVEGVVLHPRPPFCTHLSPGLNAWVRGRGIPTKSTPVALCRQIPVVEGVKEGELVQISTPPTPLRHQNAPGGPSPTSRRWGGTAPSQNQ